MTKQKYVCLGNCQAYISEEEYKNGLVACGNNSCELKGNPFVKGDKCVDCGQTYSENNPHVH